MRYVCPTESVSAENGIEITTHGKRHLGVAIRRFLDQ